METASLSQFLNYGGLGLLAILCIVVLGYNVWSLNGLVSRADPKRINAARPLLLGQMAISLIGLLSVGAGGIYLDRMKVEDNRVRSAQIFLQPWDDRLDANSLPMIRVGTARFTDQLINFDCTPGRPVTVMMNFEPFIRRRVQDGMAAQRLMAPLAAAGAGR